jgi:paraquat-inducible protein B
MMLDRTDHQRLAEQTTARIRAAAIADRYIPRTDNNPPQPIQGDDFDSLDDDDGELTYEPPPQVDPDKQLKAAREAMGELNVWLTATPVVQTPAVAKLGADWIGRSRIALKALDEERDAKVRPLNEQVKKINETYNQDTKNPFKQLVDELCKRVDVFRVAEEKKRTALADAIRLAAEQAAREAAAASAAVVEAVDNAAQGAEEDVGTLIANAEAAMHDARKLARQSTVAERDCNVRIPSVMGKAVSARTYRELIVADIEAAIIALRAMGLTERIADAICLEAKAFKAIWGELPEGVSENSERRI